MEPADRLLRLFSYDRWANNQILSTLQDYPDFPGSEQAISYYGHIAGSQEIWYGRIQGRPDNNLEIWPDYNLSGALQKLKIYNKKWLQLIENNRFELDRNVTYRNSRGEFKTPLSDILHHLIIHGQHHRAQIASLFRKAGIAPPGTDFIFFCRSN